jgi:hypothetical protein
LAPRIIQSGRFFMKMFAIVLLALWLAGCVVYPARPAYYRPAVVVY